MYHSRIVKILDMTYQKQENGNDSNPVRIIKMERLYNNGPDFFPTARQAPTDSEFTKFMKFAQRQANYYLGTQGLAVNLPEGAEVIENSLVEEGRGKKKKVTQVLLPLIMLLKLFKIKVMLAIVLASVLFIKKAVLLAAIILPSALQYLKQCASHSRHHHHAPYHFEHDDHDDGGYYGGYGKDYERAYNAASATTFWGPGLNTIRDVFNRAGNEVDAEDSKLEDMLDITKLDLFW
ncbi:hypothetical protein RN001_011968 [Aquatica leii]|uniref:Uncharacterized protein n=1 Tax=Aquatica leii TaxID=1421715 RepID=A0AAN7P571_9COLE|nr:hypothetical protein RN001_011968 [Aquatica leii]